MTDPNIIQALCREWRSTKRIEDEAKKKRVDIEEQLIGASDFQKLEGSETMTVGDYKISLTAKLDRKLDLDEYQQIADKIPEDLRPVKHKIELDIVGVKWLEVHQPDIYKLIQHCMTVKPAKTSVNIYFLGDR